MDGPCLILDGDYGIDDALALMYLTSEPGVEIAGIGSVHGNATAVAAARNALAVLEVTGTAGVPVAVGAARPLAQELEVSAEVHGADGLGGQAPAAVPCAPVETSAAEQLVALARSRPGSCTVLATGPLTNLALALLLEPELPSLVAGVVLMGGTVERPGNVAPLAEANIAHDPEAADLVFRAGWRVRQVGLDVTMSTWLEPDHLERLASDRSDRGRFAWSILGHYLDFYERRHGRRTCPLHDPTAALLAVHPGAARYLEAPTTVELRSAVNRGMLVVDRRSFVEPATPLVELAVEVDPRAVADAVVGGVLGSRRAG